MYTFSTNFGYANVTDMLLDTNLTKYSWITFITVRITLLQFTVQFYLRRDIKQIHPSLFVVHYFNEIINNIRCHDMT